MTLFVAFFLPITLALGAWQLNRAMEKNQVLAALEVSSQQSGNWIGSAAPDIGSEVEACVAFTGEQWFLDNRTLDGEVGYDVFLPAHRCNLKEAPVLVRLGWIKQAATRDELPSVDTPPADTPVIVTGQIRPTAPPPWLSSGPEAMSDRQWRFQSMDDLPDAEFRAIAPVMQLLTPEDWVLPDAWEPVNVPPERHIGYAIQWFGLGAVLVTGFLIWGIRRSKELEKRSEDDH